MTRLVLRGCATSPIGHTHTDLRYGPVVRAHLMGRPLYIVSDPQLAQEVLVTRREEFPDRFVFPQVTDLVGVRGIFFANGPEAEVRTMRLWGMGRGPFALTTFRSCLVVKLYRGTAACPCRPFIGQTF